MIDLVEIYGTRAALRSRLPAVWAWTARRSASTWARLWVLAWFRVGRR
jgi:hypothetical protein